MMQSAPIRRRYDRLEQVLRGDRVSGWNAGNVDDGRFAPGFHDSLKQVLHHGLRAAAVEGANERQSQNAASYLRDGRGQFEHFPLPDHLLAGLLVEFDSEQPQLVEQQGCGPGLGSERVRIANFLRR